MEFKYCIFYARCVGMNIDTVNGTVIAAYL